MGNSACYLDSNICIAYLQHPHVFHAKAVEILINLRKKHIVPIISPLVLDETTHIILRDARLKKKSNQILKIKKEIKKLLSVPFLRLINPPLENQKQLKIFEFMEKFKLKPRDAYHLLTMKANHVKYFASFDDDFKAVFSRGILQKF